MAKQSLASAYVQIIPSADGISGKLAEVMGGEAASAGKISGKSLGSALVGSLTKVVVAAGIGKMLQSAFTGGTAFESAMAKVGTIADTAKVPLESLSSQVLQVSGDMHIGANEIAEAAYQTISAGQDTGNAVAFAGQASMLATAGFTSSASAVDILTTALNAYGKGADEAGHVSDVLLTTQNLGKTSVDELAGSMGRVIPLAAAYNVSMENLSSGLAIMTANGIATAEASTYTKSMLKKLVRPLTAGRWCKTVGSTVWYLDVVPAQTPIVSGGANLLNFQFKLKAAFPYWRTEDTARMLLGGMEPAWFPTPVSTAGNFAISRYKHNMYTNFVNDGNAETAFTLYLQAAAKVKNPMLWNNGTRTFIRLNTTMQAHERAVICTADGNRGCRYYTADGAEDNGFRLLDIDSDLWMMLTPGDNVLRMTADEGNENLTAIVTAPKGVASGV